MEDEIARLVRFDGVHTSVRVVVILGPCRSGSTALLRAASAAGHDSYFQPLKRAIRSIVADGASEPLMFRATSRAIVVKETFGPFIDAEVNFDPIRILSMAGLHPDQLHLVVSFRPLNHMFSSWLRWFGEAPGSVTRLHRMFEAACRQTNYVYENARELGVARSIFPWCPPGESRTAQAVVREQFAIAGLDYADSCLDWRDNGDLLHGVIRQPEPSGFRVPGALDVVRSSPSFSWPVDQRLGVRPWSFSADVAGIEDRFTTNSVGN